jgi:hypothetical protein
MSDEYTLLVKWQRGDISTAEYERRLARLTEPDPNPEEAVMEEERQGGSTVTIELREETAEWLERQMGGRSFSESESREVWRQLRENLYEEKFA